MRDVMVDEMVGNGQITAIGNLKCYLRDQCYESKNPGIVFPCPDLKFPLGLLFIDNMI